jgi:hypothetical protein
MVSQIINFGRKIVTTETTNQNQGEFVLMKRTSHHGKMVVPFGCEMLSVRQLW